LICRNQLSRNTFRLKAGTGQLLSSNSFVDYHFAGADFRGGDSLFSGAAFAKGVSVLV
jgi:hypothetical protein